MTMRSGTISSTLDRRCDNRRPHDNGRPPAWCRFDLEIGADQSGALAQPDQAKSFADRLEHRRPQFPDTKRDVFVELAREFLQRFDLNAEVASFDGLRFECL